MKNLITFNFYKQNKFPFTIRIKTRDKFIPRLIKNWKTKSQHLLFSPLRIGLKQRELRPDILLYLSRLYKKCNNLEIKKSIDVYMDGIRYIPFNYKANERKFVFYTKKGSFIETNIEKRIAVGRIAEEDPFAFILLYAWLNHCVAAYYCVKLHVGCVTDDKSGTSILFIGKNGAGKSTICSLLSKTKNFRIINDDYVIAHPIVKKINRIYVGASPVFKTIRTICYSKNASNIVKINPNHLFFINKDVSLETKITPMGKKEAFRKIIFASEFPNNENEIMRQHRLDILAGLVRQCYCYSLINGRGLKENPASFLKLLLTTIKKEGHC